MLVRRRFLYALAVGSLSAIVVAAVAWEVPTGRASDFVAREVEQAYGLSFAAQGRTSLALLPSPRLNFERVSVKDGSGAAIVEDAALSVEIGVATLVMGSADLAGLIVSGGRILAARAGASAWQAPLARMTARFDRTDARSSHMRRLVIRQTALVSRDPGQETEATIVDLTASWPRWSAKMEVAGTLRIDGQPVAVNLTHLRPVELAAGGASPAKLSLEWPAGRLDLEGSASLRERPEWTGRARLRTRSMQESLALLGRPIAFGPLIDALTAESTFVAGGGRILLPTLRAKLGDDILDGAAAIAFAEGRLAVSGTLATERIDLSRLLGPLGKLIGPETTWGTQPMRLASSTASDLDLRLSAGTAILGPVRFEDVASSILVKDGRVEIGVARATLQGGTIKGRVVLAKGWQGTELKAQGTVDRMDLGGLLVELGQYRWVVGGAQGQVSVESAGVSPADLVGRLRGRAAFSIDGGELSGVNLRDVMLKNGSEGGRPVVEGPSGRTPFDRVQVGVTFADGVGEITEGGLQAASLVGALRGQLSLPERTLRARALLEGREGSKAQEPMLFEIAGPWDGISVNLKASPAPARNPLAVRPPDATRKDGLPNAASAFAQ